jgi:hypothetical protein
MELRNMLTLVVISLVLGLSVCHRDVEPKPGKVGKPTQPPQHVVRSTGRNSRILRWKRGEIPD